VLFSKILSVSSINLWDKILHWYRASALKEFLELLETKLFGLNFGEYENISLSPNAGGTIKNIIIGLIIGAILASASAFYTRAVQGKFVRELLRRECLTADTAVTLRECGFFCNPSIRRELSNSGALSKMVRCTSEISADKPVDFLTARFYVPEDDKHRAEFRYTAKGSRIPNLLLTVAVCLLAGFLLLKGIPLLLNLADWLMGMF
jgi:hypothetical protein